MNFRRSIAYFIRRTLKREKRGCSKGFIMRFFAIWGSFFGCVYLKWEEGNVKFLFILNFSFFVSFVKNYLVGSLLKFYSFFYFYKKNVY